MKREEILNCQAFQRNKQKKLKQKELALFNKAKKDFNNIVSMLIQKFKPVKIYKHGSIQNINKFKLYSDIDIVVEGLKENYFLKASAEADRLSLFEIDFQEYESLPKWKQDQLAKSGEVVYERK